jgi:hypothetical protein
MAARITLAEVRGIGGLERELVAEGNDCIDHAQRDTAVNELDRISIYSIPQRWSGSNTVAADTKKAPRHWRGAWARRVFETTFDAYFRCLSDRQGRHTPRAA